MGDIRVCVCVTELGGGQISVLVRLTYLLTKYVRSGQYVWVNSALSQDKNLEIENCFCYHI